MRWLTGKCDAYEHDLKESVTKALDELRDSIDSRENVRRALVTFRAKVNTSQTSVSPDESSPSVVFSGPCAFFASGISTTPPHEPLKTAIAGAFDKFEFEIPHHKLQGTSGVFWPFISQRLHLAETRIVSKAMNDNGLNEVGVKVTPYAISFKAPWIAEEPSVTIKERKDLDSMDYSFITHRFLHTLTATEASHLPKIRFAATGSLQHVIIKHVDYVGRPNVPLCRTDIVISVYDIEQKHRITQFRKSCTPQPPATINAFSRGDIDGDEEALREAKQWLASVWQN